METATQFEQVTADNPNNPYMLDGRLHVRFENRAVPDDAKTKLEGRPIYKEITFIEIHTPGDRDNIILRPITPKDKERFGPRYEKWQKMQTDEAMEGMPLSEWPAMPRTTLMEMRYWNIYTVEQLAEVPDGNVKKFRELFTWRKRAQEYLDVAARGAAASKLSAENAALEKRLVAQDQAIQEQAAIIRALQAKVGV